jgi:hypothetical protein
MNTEKFSVLVNTSDGFEDCWHPFFTLFERYWPDCKAQVYLNTETKIWEYPQLQITCTAVQIGIKTTLTWSECLIKALDQISTPLVLYFQEDYFISQPVRKDTINSAIELMLKNPQIKHIALTRHGSKGPYDTCAFSGFKEIRQIAKYRISTQSALWRVDTLKSYLRSEESGWMFEIYGTWRAMKKKECFLIVDFENNAPAIEYLHTGVVKGKWLKEITKVFSENGIIVDFNKRGFYKEKLPFLRKLDVAKKLLNNPLYFVRQLLER